MATSPAPTASPRPRIRHAGDLVRVSIGALAFAISAVVAAHRSVPKSEADLFRLINDLPDAATLPLSVVMQLGALAAVPVCAAIAAATRRFRLAAAVAMCGTAAWGLAKVAKSVVGRVRPSGFFSDLTVRGTIEGGLGFPSGHCAVAAAMATVASPYLTRNGRRWSWAAVGLVGVGRIYVGAHLPLDVAGGIALGAMVGGAVSFALGAPWNGPSPEAVQVALQRAGLAISEVRPISVDARGSVPLVASLVTTDVPTADADEGVFLKVIGRDERNADWLFKLWRFLAFRDVRDERPFSTTRREVEHEAFVSLLARAHGVRTPDVLTTADIEGASVMVQRRIDATPLDEIDARRVTPEVLSSLWQVVSTLHDARIAHRDLRLANVMVDQDDEPWLIDFGFAEASAPQANIDRDIAELLASSALVVGCERSVAAAHNVLDDGRLSAAIAHLQPLALSGATRTAMKAHGHLLNELRAHVADVTGAESSKPEPVLRVRLKSVLMLAVIGIAVHLLIPQLGELDRSWEAMRKASFAWLAASTLAAFGTYLAATVAQLGAVEAPLPFGRTLAVQFAGSFANRITPGSVGGLGISVRYLERSGLDRPTAAASVGLNTFAGFLVHIAMLAVAVPIAGRTARWPVHLPDNWILVAIVVVVCLVVGLATGTNLGRQRVIVPARNAASSVAIVLRSPLRAAQLFGGSFGVTFTNAVALNFALHAVDAHASFAIVAAVYLGGSAIASVAPTPGGLGAMEAALVTGLTAAGVAAAPSVAGVLIYRLLTYWLPTVVGWLSYRSLTKIDAL